MRETYKQNSVRFVYEQQLGELNYFHDRRSDDNFIHHLFVSSYVECHTVGTEKRGHQQHPIRLSRVDYCDEQRPGRFVITQRRQ